MTSVRIWTVESDHDHKTVKRLANDLVTDLQLGNLSIQTASKRALPTHKIKGTSLSDTLRKATQMYLEQDDYVIFVTDQEHPTSIHQGWRKADSLINQIQQVVNDSSFADKVFFTRTVHELEECLPIVYKSLEAGPRTWEEKWDSTLAHFHEAFADIPEEELIQDFEEALAEVRNERT